MKRKIRRWENAANGEVFFSYSCAQKCEGENAFAYVKVKFGKDCPRVPSKSEFYIDSVSENMKFKLGEFDGKKVAILDTIWINDFEADGFEQVEEPIPF